jgi:hypothetical protein
MVDGIEVRLVDGSVVRRDIDPDFTTVSHHYRCPTIPMGVLWVDHSVPVSEKRFVIGRGLAELRAALSVGGDVVAMSDMGAFHERELRGDPVTSDQDDVRLEAYRVCADGVRPYVVNGQVVRSRHDVDFVCGGHDLVRSYIPAMEVWIDDTVSPAERAYSLIHELFERRLMAGGMDYEAAHSLALAVEQSARLRAKDMDAAALFRT